MTEKQREEEIALRRAQNIDDSSSFKKQSRGKRQRIKKRESNSMTMEIEGNQRYL